MFDSLRNTARRLRRRSRALVPSRGLSERGLASPSRDIADGSAHADRTLVIAASRRSGSNLLCSSIESTGLGGAPTEYLAAHSMRGFRLRFGSPRVSRRGRLQQVARLLRGRARWYQTWYVERDSFDRYLADVVGHRTSANGVFGLKVFPDHLEKLAEHVDFDIDDLPGEKRWVFLYRRDLLGQAISLVRAQHSGLWFHREGEATGDPEAAYVSRPGAPKYDGAALLAAIESFRADNEWWRAEFERRGITPLELCYEDLVTDVAGSVNRVMALLGEEPVVEPVVGTRRQADAANDDLRRRFLAEYPDWATASP